MVYLKIEKQKLSQPKNYIKICNKYFVLLIKTDIMLAISKLFFLIPYFITLFYTHGNILMSNAIKILILFLYLVMTSFSFPLVYERGISGEKAITLSIKYVKENKEKCLPIYIIIFGKCVINYIISYVLVILKKTSFNYWLFSLTNNLVNIFTSILIFIISLIILKKINDNEIKKVE